MSDYALQFDRVLDACRLQLSNLKPSEWYEANMVMPQGSAFAGPYRYRRSPYLREIIDCLGKDHPAHTISVMKGAQIGVSAGVLTPAIGYTMALLPALIMSIYWH